MKKALKVIGKTAGLAALVYAGLFAVYYFDLDGKALYHFVEPMMKKRFDAMERRNPLDRPYNMIDTEYMARKD